MKMLERAPKELMLVEADEDTDPYNSGIYKRPTAEDLLFLLDGKPVIGDTSTIVEDLWS